MIFSVSGLIRKNCPKCGGDWEDSSSSTNFVIKLLLFFIVNLYLPTRLRKNIRRKGNHVEEVASFENTRLVQDDLKANKWS